MVHLLALRRAELHLSDQVCGRAGFHALRFLAWLRKLQRRTSPGEGEKQTWPAKIRVGNRKNQAARAGRRTRRRQSKLSRARSGRLTFAGTTARRISSSQVGNGSRAGAAARWFTRRKITPHSASRRFVDALAQRNFPRHGRDASHRLLINAFQNLSLRFFIARPRWSVTSIPILP